MKMVHSQEQDSFKHPTAFGKEQSKHTVALFIEFDQHASLFPRLNIGYSLIIIFIIDIYTAPLQMDTKLKNTKIITIKRKCRKTEEKDNP